MSNQQLCQRGIHGSRTKIPVLLGTSGPSYGIRKDACTVHATERALPNQPTFLKTWALPFSFTSPGIFRTDGSHHPILIVAVLRALRDVVLYHTSLPGLFQYWHGVHSQIAQPWHRYDSGTRMNQWASSRKTLSLQPFFQLLHTRGDLLTQGMPQKHRNQAD